MFLRPRSCFCKTDEIERGVKFPVPGCVGPRSLLAVVDDRAMPSLTVPFQAAAAWQAQIDTDNRHRQGRQGRQESPGPGCAIPASERPPRTVELWGTRKVAGKRADPCHAGRPTNPIPSLTTVANRFGLGVYSKKIRSDVYFP